MKRPAYALLVGVAILMGIIAVVASKALDEHLRDPDGFLGPAWFRLPAMVVAAFVVDVLPRSLWRASPRIRDVPTQMRRVIREHWTPDRMKLVVIGLTSFYVTYVSYRNLKNYLPRLHAPCDTCAPHTQDRTLHQLDKLLMFGHEPAVILHNVLGDHLAAHVLAYVYLIFLPVAPLSVVIWLVWSRNISYGYWYATANGLCWMLGTVSYYAVPTLGPGFYYPWLYRDLDPTGITDLQAALWNSRQDSRLDPLGGSIQSVAGFASLHVAIILAIALVAHYTVRHAVIRYTLWVYFGATVVSTLYFGWHYIADDVAGALIAITAVYVGGIATGQHFDRHGRSSHPTTSTADVPVDDEPANVGS